MQSFTTEEKLQERIKELSCLYNVSSALLNDESVDDTLANVCRILKKAWLYPKDAVVELQLESYSASTSSIPENSIFQEIPLKIFHDVKGFIKVHYDSDKHKPSDFLEDEQKLLVIVGSKVSNYYEKIILKRSAERTDRLSILGEITAGIAHELNTPLGNILGFAELINERSTDEQSVRDSDKVIKAAIYAREIVKKLMFFSCEMPQHMAVIQIQPIVNESLRLLEPSFRKAGVTYDFTIDDPDMTAQVDTIQLTQVLFNILINSLYFSPEGSQIRIGITSDKTDFSIRISDLGPGISDSDKLRIFEPFYTTKPFGDGTGLGLSVVHGIVKSHRGKISVKDNVPQGTTFEIQLPKIQR